MMNALMANWKELVGYLAPVFIVLSMMQSNILYIRIYMLLGCVTFVLYGIFVEAWPVVIANFIIGVVTFYFLIRSLYKR